MFVLGTAGHIDHGKSLLIKTLTGIDPDRLQQEKERGMTIELGFAWLKLPGGREVGIVDVPGHERFVKNMLAGVGGIDLALLIVAANEGVMPQTREHLAILDLLEVSRGIAVITKKDLVDDELLTLVRMEVEEVLSSTMLAGAPVIAVSALTGEGLPELTQIIDELLDTTPSRPDLGRPRLSVDRIFTMAGSGTVVTGTLIDGELSVGQEIEIVPSGLKSRLRGLQTHKSKIEKAAPGSRVAANLVGINKSQLTRGDVVTNPGWLKPSRIITVKLRLISYLQHPIRHGTTVSFHTGASETMAKVRLLEGDELAPGGSTWAQLSLERPVAVVKGDHYIVRSPMETLGGGTIVEAGAKRLRRFHPEVIQNLRARDEGTSDEVILALIEAKQPRELASLVNQSNLPDEETVNVVESLVQQGKIISMGEGARRLLFTQDGWKSLTGKVVKILEEYHRKYPARSGMPGLELSGRLKLGGYAPTALENMSAQKVIIEEGGQYRLPSHAIRLTAAQQAKLDAFLDALVKNPYAPPSELIPEPDLLNMLVGQGKVVRISDTVVFSVPVYDDMVTKITARIKTAGKVGLAEVRDMFGTSRKYAQALLEYLDGQKITRRVGDDRVLY
ncbi:MAG TPA: selenocysteine-specific translation elongation factor [Dehalococcoidia bacterium]|nr:selenocysteine-specific translation elongation factor [Dehalococcoidia bacterium]